MRNKARIGVVVVVRDEMPIIADWLAYYAELGVDTLIVYDNASNDHTAKIIDLASSEIDIRYVWWPHHDGAFQCRAYADSVRRFGRELDWMAFLDADEFITIESGQSLEDKLSSYDGYSAIAINWLIFGSRQHEGSSSLLAPERFLWRSHIDFEPNIHVKMIVRPNKFRAMPNPHYTKVKGAISDPGGAPIVWRDKGLSSQVNAVDTMAINHYFVRSRADWEKKIKRGYKDSARPESDFAAYDRNEVYDDRAASVCERARHRYKFLTCISRDA